MELLRLPVDGARSVAIPKTYPCLTRGGVNLRKLVAWTSFLQTQKCGGTGGHTSIREDVV